MTGFWRINPAVCLHWRHWEEAYVLFNAASAQTHLLNDFGMDVLDILKQAPHSAPELSERLASHFQIEWDNQAQSYLQSLLVNLDELGLIEPCVP